MSKRFEVLNRIDREFELLKPADRLTFRADAYPVLPIDQASRSEVEKLVNRLFLLPSSPPNVVVFTALEPRSGCSRVCAHAADLFASKVNASVCLVDANLDQPSLHTRFGVPNQSGLTDILKDVGWDMKNVTSQVPGGVLWLMTCGSPDHDRELLGRSPILSARMAELRGRFDFVLIDAPSTSASEAAFVLGRLADGVVVVVQANSTRREAVRLMTEEFEENHVRVLGAVLHGRTYPIPEVIYKRL